MYEKKREKFELFRNDERLFFVVLQAGRDSIFADDRVEEFWLFFEDVGCDPDEFSATQYDMYHVIMKALNPPTRQLVREWRGLSYVCFVERNQFLKINGMPVVLPSLELISNTKS